MQREHATRDRGVLEGAPQQARALDRPPVIREADGAGIGERRELRELRTELAERDGAEEPDGDDRLAGRALVQRLHDRGGVDHRVGVRHREDRPETAGGSCGRTRGDVLLVLLPGCSEVHVRIDEGREQREPVGIHHLGVIRHDEIVSECRDDAGTHEDVRARVDPGAGVDDVRTTNEQRGRLALADGEESGPAHHATASRAATSGAGTDDPSSRS